MTRVVVAPDSFKGSLDAAAVAAAIAQGWLSVRPDDEVVLRPQADGGEGTLDAIATALPDSIRHRVSGVTGPDGRPVDAEWLELPDGTAVVEIASPSGLPLMSTPDPLGATTRGLGEVIAAALDAGATSLTIGLGGSASTDGGAGALRALGLRLTDAAGDEIADGGGALARLAHVDRSVLRPPPPGGVRLLSDVSAPLSGPRGAAAVFGPQKGATTGDVARLDAALAHYAGLLGGDVDVPGVGAAGGTGFGFLAAWGATIESGSEVIAHLTGVDATVTDADILLTGEGRFDGTSLAGKVVGNALAIADRAGARVGIIAGSVAADPRTPTGRPVWSASLVDLAGSLDSALAEPARWLRAAGSLAAHEFE